MMTLGWSWPFYNKFNNGKMVNHKIPWKVLKIWPKNWYMQLTKWVYEDLWVQEVKVILRPLNQGSHILTILSFSSKVTRSIITKFHIELPSFIICSNGPGHMPNMIFFFPKSSSLEPIDRWFSYFICRIQYSSTAKIVQMITLGWPWYF